VSAVPRLPLLSLAWRESRTARRRLLVYMSAISLGVAALVAIDSFASNTQKSVREQARALLGGDISLSSRQPFTARVTAALDSMRARGVAYADVTTFGSMALVERTGRTRLAQIRAVSVGYPFYGQIVTAPADAWSRLQRGRVALVDPSLLVSLNARVGDTLSLGNSRFTIIGTLVSVPGDVSEMSPPRRARACSRTLFWVLLANESMATSAATPSEMADM
jgi:putative ABC transport system permease protein